MTKKKSILIILVIIILVLIALLLFYLLYSRQIDVGVDFPPTGEPGTDFPPGTDPGTDPGTGFPPGTDPGVVVGTEPPDRYSNYPQAYNRLKRISSLPVAGTIVFDKADDTLIRYVERGSGDLFETRAVTAESPYRIARTSILKIHEAYWTNKGEGVILRYLKEGIDDIQNFYLAVSGGASGSEATLSGGTFLSPSISAMTVSPSTEKIFYVLKSGDTSYGIISNPNGTNRVQIFESPMSEWRPFWNDPNIVIMNTKPSADVLGFVYALNTQTSEWKRVIGNTLALMVMPNDNTSAMVYFRNLFNGQETGIYYPSNNSLIRLSVKTLPEKCVWSEVDRNTVFCAAEGAGFLVNEPDNWYMGLTSFDDKVWKINLTTGQTTMVFDPRVLVQTPMDMIDLMLDGEDKYLVFQNKKDLSLWLYELE